MCTSLGVLIHFLYLHIGVTTLTSPLNPVTTTINFYSREAFRLDLNNSLNSIKSRVGIEDMNIPKRNPHIAVLNGKIYVWGGIHLDYYLETSG